VDRRPPRLRCKVREKQCFCASMLYSFCNASLSLAVLSMLAITYLVYSNLNCFF
jgi:hypothetical protein